MATFDPIVPDYRYFVTDLLTNDILAEIPFIGVSYERAIKSAGSFSGSVPIVDKTAAMDIYDNTMPGRTGLYVVRNNECVWGGIIWSRSYSVVDKSVSVNAAEFTSYLYHRNIWKTFSHEYSATMTTISGVSKIDLDTGSYPFSSGMPVKITILQNISSDQSGTYDILPSPAPTSTQFRISTPGILNGVYSGVTVTVRVDTYDYVRSLVTQTLNDFVDIDFPNNEIEPAKKYIDTVTHKQVSSGSAILTLSAAHGVQPGQTIQVTNVGAPFDGVFTVTDVTTTTVRYDVTSANIGYTAVSPITFTVSHKSNSAPDDTTLPSSTFYAVLVTATTPTFLPGDLIEVIGVDDPSGTEKIFNGSHYVESVNTSTNRVTYYSGSPTTVIYSAAPVGANIARIPSIVYGTYGSYPSNSNIGIEFSTEEYSGVSVANKLYRGSELRSVGEELDEYSDTVDGFEYRIDCDYDTVTSSFKRTFVLLPINYPDPPPPGEPSPIERFGAQNLIFEYPGNVMNVSMDESAEDAATRFFVVGSDESLSSDASQPYAVATAQDLLLQGWPLLDNEETRNGEFNEEELYSHAQRYLSEFKPPVSDIKVTVNGSVTPVIGSYVPGDWCCLIIDDDFVQMRLSSELEIRSEILLRKIESYKVSVPDGSSFPETVELNLITESEVDKIGE
jgi:hypothetical protein